MRDSTFWDSWHGAYHDPDSSLSRRLTVVQAEVDRWLDATAPRSVRVLSVCAGDGRDLLEVLARRSDADRVTATLVELDAGLVSRAREYASLARLAQVQVRAGDAGSPSTYAGLPPADLVLLCGVLGNVPDADVEHTIAALPALCADGARVIWTRTRRPPDLTPHVRELFSRNGFHGVAFITVADSLATVGVADLTVPTDRVLGPGRIFTFTSSSPNRRTLNTYETRADCYRESQGPPSGWHTTFLDRIASSLPDGGKVLELGSATGRDARYLAEQGLRVHPTDATTAFVERMRQDGLDARLLDMLTDDLGGPWDAVVAFAVLLHLTHEELGAVLDKARAALPPGGLLAFSVKEGDGAGWSDHKLGMPRYFTYWRAKPMRTLLEDHGWERVTVERHEGVRDDWLTVVAHRPATGG